MESVRKYFRIILNIIIPLLMMWGACVIGPKILRFFMPFVIGAVIAMIANPVVRFLERRLKIVRRHGSVLIIVLVLAFIIAILYVLISKLVLESRSLLVDLPSLYETVSLELQSVMRSFEHILLRLPANVQEEVIRFNQNLGQYISLAVQKMAFPTVSVAGNMAKGIPSFLVYTIVTIVSAYFFIAERDRMVFYVKQYMPEGVTSYLMFLQEDLKRLLGGYFLAQFRIMFVVALILAVGFLFLQARYGLLLAVLVAILDFLPLFGTGTVLIPWAIVKLISGEYFFAVGLILLYVLTQVVRQIIQPKIVGDSMGISPSMTLFLMYLGFKIQGLSGMILAVPVGIFVINLYHFGIFNSLIENVKLLFYEINRFRKGN